MFLREYETITIVDPDAGQDGLDKVLDRMREALGKTGGREVRLEDWGRRKLAYEMGRRRKGHYLYLRYLGTNATVRELERLLGITEESVKYQSILLDQRVIEADYDFDTNAKDLTLIGQSVASRAANEAPAPAPGAPTAAVKAGEDDNHDA